MKFSGIVFEQTGYFLLVLPRESGSQHFPPEMTFKKWSPTPTSPVLNQATTPYKANFPGGKKSLKLAHDIVNNCTAAPSASCYE
jgi:hypothetical protein